MTTPAVATTFTFNRRPLTVGAVMEAPSVDLVRNTLGLVNASADDAVRYGGDVTREALSTIALRNDRKYVVVDVKVHMLMPGMCPAIPGWHTDGVPRDPHTLSPVGRAMPSHRLLEAVERGGTSVRPTHYHLIATGEGCLTHFVETSDVTLDLPDETPDLYESMSRQVNERVARGDLSVYVAPSCTAVGFDWLTIHQGVPAGRKEWRYLIRVTESDTLPPDTNLRSVIRTQQQVYAPTNFGW